MGNKCKRFLVALMMVFLLVSLAGLNVFAAEEAENTELECYTYGDVNCDGVVDQKDAIYLLYHCTQGAEQYPLNGRDGHMDEDDDIDKDDALHLLFHTFPAFAEKYPLPQTEVHEYAKPSWAWVETEEGMTATVTIKCECKVTEIPAEVTKGETVPANCETDGKEVYSAVAGDYTSSFEVALPKLGHKVTPTCAGEAACENGCGHTVAALKHQYTDRVEDQCVKATCGAPGKTVTKCANCDATKEEVIPATGNHSFGEEQQVPVEGASCTYQDVKVCSVCEHEVRTDAYEKHKHEVVVSFTPATCVAKGVRTYKCENCEDTKDYPVAVDPSAHTWVQDAEQKVEGSTTYTCSGCGETKTVMSVAADSAVSAEDLKNKELSLDNGASVGMSKAELPENVTSVKVSVTEATDEAVAKLEPGQKDQIAGQTVYDFNVTDTNNEKVAFNGEVTVTLPYVLGENENIDEIAVWFISDEGNLEAIPATYADGFITFTTDHFSYYTVTRLTIEERCALYGHKYGTPMVVEPSCGKEGYTKKVCQRCLNVEITDEQPALEHNYQPTEKNLAASCDADGWFSEKCQNCGDEVAYKLSKLGHDYQLAEHKDASCKEAGKDVYSCSKCEAGYEVVIPQSAHAEFKTVTQAATCTEKGYEKKVCTACDFEKDLKEIPALGHTYADQNHEDEAKRPVWNWVFDEDGELNDVTVTLHCVACDNTKEMTAVVHENDNTTCAGGEIIYTAKVSWNKVNYQDSKTVTVTYAGHTVGKWIHNVTSHYHICAECGEKVDMADHIWTEQSRTEATCGAKGEVVSKCICGREKKETLAATGNHTLENGVCTECGFVSNECKHIQKLVTYNLADYGACGGWVEVSTCDCGEKFRIDDWLYACEFDEPVITKATSQAGNPYEIETVKCKHCGLKTVGYGYSEISKDPCGHLAISYTGIFVGDQAIAEDPHVFNMIPHPMSKYEPVDLTKLGLCSEKLDVAVCPCGEMQDWMPTQSCFWELDEARSNDMTTYLVCSKCNAVKIMQDAYREDPENCAWYLGTITTYQVNGKDVYTLSYVWKNPRHDTVVTDYELAGDSCEDGLYYVETCQRCGIEQSWTDTYHYGINRQVLDLSSYDICYDSIELTTCPCSVGMRNYYLNGAYCNFNRDDSRSDDTKETWVCSECGAIREDVTIRGEKNENCEYIETTEYTLYDKNGNRILRYYYDYKTSEHNVESTYTLLGSSCTDGVREVRKCLDCGKVTRDWTYTDHRDTFDDCIDLTDLGLCGIEKLNVWDCACGEDFDWEYSHNSNSDCDRYRIDDEDGHYTTKCDTCGVVIDEFTEIVKEIDDCHSIEALTFTFSNDTTSKSVTYEHRVSHHDLEVSVRLDEGSQTCEDGIYITHTCNRCDYSTSWHDSYHAGAVVKKELLSEGELCGTFYQADYACACGQDVWTTREWVGGECDFEWRYVEEIDRDAYVCVNCGAYRYEVDCNERAIPNSCEYEATAIYAYFKDGKELFRYEEKRNGTNHNWQYSFTLHGKTCDDGYDYTAVCADCGATRNATDMYGHEWHGSYTKLIDRADICGTVWFYKDGCACGELDDYSWGNNSCEFEWVYDETLNRNVYKCADCGLIRYTESTSSTPDENCNVTITETCIFKLGNEILTTKDVVHTNKNHNWGKEFRLDGETCADGYFYTDVCVRCGQRGEENGIYYGDCSTYSLEKIALYDGEGYCGEIYVRRYSCPCGKNAGYWVEHSACSMNSEWNQELDAEVYSCVDCGFTYYRDSVYSKPDNNCNITVNETLFVLKNGQYEAVYSEARKTKQHNWTTEFECFGETCADGYTYTDVCVRCGFRDETSEIYYNDCNNATYAMEKIVLHDGENQCGEFSVRLVRCACGGYQYLEENHPCDVNGEWDEELKTHIYRCSDCDLAHYETIVSGEVDENCNVTRTETATLLVGDEVYNSYSVTYTAKDHDEVYDYELYGESCDDGFDVYKVCQREGCGYRRLYDDNRTGHETWMIEHIDLADYGFCGGHISKYRCACGQEQFVDSSVNCDYNHVDYDEATGYAKYYCTECGTTFFREDGEKHNKETCKDEGPFFFQAFRNDEVLLTVEEEQHSTHHTYVAKDFALNDGVSCDNDYSVSVECYYCGASESYERYGHDIWCIEYVDLSEWGSECGGYLEQTRCACGKYEDYNYDGHSISWKGEWTEKDENGVVHTFDEGYCTECALEVKEEYYYEMTGVGCEATHYVYRTFSLGDKSKKLVHKCDTTNHDWDDGIYVLEEGAKVCSDGITCIQTCQRCGATDEYHCGTSEHAFMNVLDDSIDLTQYGSVCGEWLLHLKCPCGAEERWDFDHDHCDLDRTEATSLYEDSYMRPWVEEVISRNELGGKLIHDQNGQPSSEGHRTTTSYGYVYTCAVTNPQCAMKVRMAEYWVVDDCVATEYQTWQLGYDKEAGTWMHEITVATGDKHPYHAYEDVDVPDETLDDGTHIDTYKHVCADCGSYYQYQYFYKNDEQIKSVETYVNTMDNGENKSRTIIQEYGVELPYSYTHTDGTVYEGTERYETLEEYRYVKADGTEYWNKYEHIYSGENCMWSVVSTDSNGYYDAYDTTRHYAPGWFYETLEEATCSQPGLQRRYNVCYICHVKPNDDTFEITPDHSWDWDYEKQTYVCAVCELENINGADGFIIMEDLTEKYGNGENYVIGYYERNNVRFSPYVSVIFDELAEDADREMKLDGIEIAEHTKANDGFKGMSFNKQAAIEAALAKIAEQGYEGNVYSIRISLVPVNDEYDLDYAITFDSLTVEETAN